MAGAAAAGVGTAGALVAVVMLGAAATVALVGIVFALVWPLAAVIKHLADEPITQSSAAIAAYAAGAVLCLPGVARLITWGAVGLAIMLVVAGAFVGLDLVVGRLPRRERRLTRDEELDDERLIASLRCPLSIEELCGVWSETAATLADNAGTRDRQAVAEVRRICLDEFERRNPAGFQQWIEAGAPSDPKSYLLPEPEPES
ncbi:hypothetical protein [Kribbella sp. NPDC051770]|uniref:hypothetical protein n=1 Tax=Kribbella sp. NPDC051770 TaxID=3155413 RepID=UPI0034454098